MADVDPRQLDWPFPVQGGGDEDVPDVAEALQKASEGIRQDLRRVSDDKAQLFVDLLARYFDDSPSPADSVAGVERLLHHQPEAAAEFVEKALGNPQAFRRMLIALGHSRSLGRHVCQQGWRALLELQDEDLQQALTPALVAARARDKLAAGQDVLSALRQNHHDLALRVLLREVMLKRPLEEISREISALADGALAVALDWTRQEFKNKRQWEEAANFRVCVLAFGKHGAEELNYSSDIDLVFVFEGDGPRGQSGQQYAVKLAESLIPLLDEVTPDGMVFRVDTRLRPEGKRGRLARSVQGTLDYYYSYGSTWERQALIKARPCAGDVALGAAMLEKLQPWVFRKYLTVEEINQIQSVKSSIEKRTDARAETFLDVKTGFGGIRDIEFVTQFLQLLNGGRMPEVRQRATLSALNALARHGVLRRSEADELADAYRFLRSVEHRLQLWEGHQTHTLPDVARDLSRLGRSLGYSGPRGLDPARQLLTRLKLHTLHCRGLMVRLFAGLFGNAAPQESQLVLDPDLEPAQAAPILARYGFVDASGAFAAIRALATESSENRLYAPRARKYLASMMPALLDFAAQSADPDGTLRNFERIAANLGAKTMLFELIAEDPRALAIFGGIAANSDWLSDMLARRPGLVDEFIDGLQTFSALDRQRLEADLIFRLQSAETPLDALFWQRDVETLRIGLFDISGRTPLPETLRELCVLAEVILQATLYDAVARESARETARDPGAMAGNPRDFLAVIGMGKLGSGALNYASDLDLVFAYQPGALADAALEPAFYTRVVRRVLDTLTTSSERGKLYDIDLRLRPHGNKGALVVTLDELQKYLADGAGFWERIAACRARVLNAQSTAGTRARLVLDSFCYSAGGDATAIRQMRAKLEQSGNAQDLKRAAGGTLDIEFVLAHLQLSHGQRLPALRQPDVFEALLACRDFGLIDARTHDAMAEAYVFLRQCLNRLRLFDGQPVDELPTGEGLKTFARRMGYKGSEAVDHLAEELNWHRKSAREAFEALVR
ncbi:MAG: bifunctional [glutamate--ammonia ligase]-adenylyl-L-tyrosine phosphorylase/[glutamate--ammonia-ligase] adenylyltransferase [Planctomycetes bacterium]|nr:bifunctional [glutamate--ammonia ligase]-adenylyl-L-tyrosine phosphorylase/[glutamate--ammonia-ligase] adenylyltransferase [Planctomycetota bacterium]